MDIDSRLKAIETNQQIIIQLLHVMIGYMGQRAGQKLGTQLMEEAEEKLANLGHTRS